MALSIGSGNTVPIARTDKHVVLAMSPARPKVSSMQAKLDHTKIDTSLYEQVMWKIPLCIFCLCTHQVLTLKSDKKLNIHVLTCAIVY